jgi:hypothetical protein
MSSKINEEQTMAKVSVDGARGTPCNLDGISLASAIEDI